LKFSELGLSPELLTAIEKHGYQEATPIQEKTIPLTLAGKDVIGQAQTGTGKTAAFGLPIIEHIDTNKKVIQALIVSPTRELAMQTNDELSQLGRDKKIHTTVVFGGAPIGRQISNLEHIVPEILVGTPGRLIDHIKRGTINLNEIKTLVLDEADEMLNMGFLADIEAIIAQTPSNRQTLLFSATMPKEIKNIGVKFMNNPEHIQIEAKELTTDLVEQYYVNSREYEKFDNMTNLLAVQRPELAIVFGRTKRRVDELTRGLEMRGYKAAGMHGDLDQHARTRTLKSFKSGDLQILVATDVAARGLDISDVTHVYNYDIPQDPESYVHRIGRTGRAGKSGISVTFVTRNELGYLREIEKLTKKRMQSLKPATKEDAHLARLHNSRIEASEILSALDVDDLGIAKDAESLANMFDAKMLAGALLSVLARDEEANRDVTIAEEKPLPRHKSDRDFKSDRSSSRGNNSRGERSGSSYGRSDRRNSGGNSGFKSNSRGRGPKTDEVSPFIDRGHRKAGDRKNENRKPKPLGVKKSAPKKRDFTIV
jgi:ATP-dependent RNA helicase DeaD